MKNALLFCALSLLATSLCRPARADAVYEFAGDPSLTASLDLQSALGASFSGDPGFLSLAINGSHFDCLSLAYGGGAQFQTDANGNITFWTINLYGPPFYPFNGGPLWTFQASGNGSDNFFYFTSYGGSSFSIDTPGTWELADPAPEPSSLILLATGLLGLGPFLRRVAH